MTKQFWAVIVVIILIFVGIFAFGGKKSNTSSTSTAALSQHIEGKNSANVTLTEYGDYECPYCGQYYPTVKQVETEFNDQIHFQFRNFPLVNIHQNAFAGARAAEAASLQGKFWEMHDLLYENQTTWSAGSDPTPYFKAYAKQIGLNATQFQTDYASSKVNDTINADMAEGNKLNIQGTPAFFIDGKEVQVGNSVAQFEKIIKDAIGNKAPSGAGTTSQTTTSGTGTANSADTTGSSNTTPNPSDTTTSGQ